MSEWHPARLIPTAGIDSPKEAEARATSALLAVLSIVRPLSKALLDPLGASRANNATVEAFVEVQFDHERRRVRPDGVIRVYHGNKPAWVAIVEVKTGDNELNAEQLNLYWDIARANNFDAVISISSQISPLSGAHPVAGLKVKSTAKVPIHHFSWSEILSEAITQMSHRGVEDVEQAWILSELIRYLQNPASGAYQFRDMGPCWVEVRTAARDRALLAKEPRTLDIVDHWDELLQYAALRLGSEIGQRIEVVGLNGKRVDPSRRRSDLATDLAERGLLHGALRVPNTAGDLEIHADLRAQQLTAALNVEAPRDKGARGRISWLVGQLDQAPERTVVESWPRNGRAATTATGIASAREDRTVMLAPDGKEPARFRLILRSPMGVARKAGGRTAGFVDTVLQLIDGFYGDVVQNIMPWQPPTPRRPAPPPGPEVADAGAVVATVPQLNEPAALLPPHLIPVKLDNPPE